MTDAPNDDGSARTLTTVETTCRVIRALEAHNGARVTELADYLDLSKSAVYNHLTTLRRNNFIVKDGDVYELSYQFLLLGEFVRNQNTLYELGRHEIEKLAEETGEYAHLSTEQHGLTINLYKVRGEKAVGSAYQTAKLQKPDYLHHSATGKAIMAYLPEERVEEIVDTHGLARKTENTITDREELFDCLADVRERGYAYNDEEEVEGLRAVGAPIRDRDGRVLGSLSVSGPTSRMKDEHLHETIPEMVTSTANVIEVNINMAERTTDLPGFD